MRHHRAGERERAGRACARRSSTCMPCGAPRGSTQPPARQSRRACRRRRAAPATRPISPNTGMSTSVARRAMRCSRQPLRRAPDREHGGRQAGPDQSGFGEPHHHRARQHRDGAAFVGALAGEDGGRERMMQHERAAGRAATARRWSRAPRTMRARARRASRRPARCALRDAPRARRRSVRHGCARPARCPRRVMSKVTSAT